MPFVPRGYYVCGAIENSTDVHGIVAPDMYMYCDAQNELVTWLPIYKVMRRQSCRRITLYIGSHVACTCRMPEGKCKPRVYDTAVHTCIAAYTCNVAADVHVTW